MIRFISIALCVAAGFCVALPAQALQHFMKVREVYLGPMDDPAAQYINLQMYSALQNLVEGHSVQVFDATDTIIGTYTFPTHLVNGLDQAYILIASPEAEARFGVTADLLMTPDLQPAGGKLCFGAFDCFAWGNYVGDPDSPDATGTPFNPADESGLPPGQAVRRDISAGNPDALEDADDTGDSAADFAIADQPRPISNLDSSQLTMPAEQVAAGAATGGGTADLGWLLLSWLAQRRYRRRHRATD